MNIAISDRPTRLSKTPQMKKRGAAVVSPRVRKPVENWERCEWEAGLGRVKTGSSAHALDKSYVRPMFLATL